jgi:hypothetical protein
LYSLNIKDTANINNELRIRKVNVTSQMLEY